MVNMQLKLNELRRRSTSNILSRKLNPSHILLASPTLPSQRTDKPVWLELNLSAKP